MKACLKEKVRKLVNSNAISPEYDEPEYELQGQPPRQVPPAYAAGVGGGDPGKEHQDHQPEGGDESVPVLPRVYHQEYDDGQEGQQVAGEEEGRSLQGGGEGDGGGREVATAEEDAAGGRGEPGTKWDFYGKWFTAAAS